VTDSNLAGQAKIQAENHTMCVDWFIELANAMKDEGLAPVLNYF
jgi:hypothetical protein